MLLELRDRSEIGVIHIQRRVLAVEQVEDVGAIILIRDDRGAERGFGLRPKGFLLEINEALGCICTHECFLNLSKYCQPGRLKFRLPLRRCRLSLMDF